MQRVIPHLDTSYITFLTFVKLGSHFSVDSCLFTIWQISFMTWQHSIYFLSGIILYDTHSCHSLVLFLWLVGLVLVVTVGLGSPQKFTG